MIPLSSCYNDSSSYDFSHCASIHSLFDEMIFALVPLIFFQGIEVHVIMLIRLYIPHAFTLLYEHAHLLNPMLIVQRQNGGHYIQLYVAHNIIFSKVVLLKRNPQPDQSECWANIRSIVSKTIIILL